MNDPPDLPDQPGLPPDQQPDELRSRDADEAELPPVEVPSARFIAQLFLVPAVIVGGIVSLVFCFGWVGSGTRDWQSQVIDLARDNPHRRDRAAYDLAQLLNSDHKTPEGHSLREHAPLATALADLTRQRLELTPTAEKELDHNRQLTLLIGLLGLLDAPRTTLPLLCEAIATGRDPLIRKTGLEAIASVGKRSLDAGTPLDDAATVKRLVAVIADGEGDLKRDALAALGTLDTPLARRQLEASLTDSDPIARYNAAVALLYQDSSRGLNVLRDILKEAADNPESLSLTAPKTVSQKEAFERRWLLVTRSLRAIGNRGGALSAAEKREFREVITPLAEGHRPVRIRIDAARCLQRLGN